MTENSTKCDLAGLMGEYAEAISNPIEDELRSVQLRGDGFRIPVNDLASSSILVASTRGTQSAFQWKVERSMAAGHEFWKRRKDDFKRAMAEAQGLQVRVASDTNTPNELARLALLFDTVCICDASSDVNYPGIMRQFSGDDYLAWLRQAFAVTRLLGDRSNDPFPPIVVCPSDTRTDFVPIGQHVTASFLGRMLSHSGAPSVSDIRSIGRLLEEESRQLDWSRLEPLLPSREELQRDSSEARSFPGLLDICNRKFSPRHVQVLVEYLTFLWAVLYRYEASAGEIRVVDSLAPAYWAAMIERNNLVESQWRTEVEVPRDCRLSNLLQTRFQWLSGITCADVAALRRSALLDPVRSIFRDEARKMAGATDTDFGARAEEMESNIRTGLRTLADKQDRIASDTRKILQRTSVSFGVTIALTACSFAFPTFAPLAIGSGLLSVLYGTASAREVWRAWQDRDSVAGNVGSLPLRFLLDATDNR